jgi:Spx/MgsR family transcriptional regulator
MLIYKKQAQSVGFILLKDVMVINIYGIKNCDTMKKAFKTFDSEEIGYIFHDYKKEAPSEGLLKKFIEKAGLDNVVNKRGTTYRKLSDEQKQAVEHVESALPILQANSSMIKRPIVELPDGQVIVGFGPHLVEKIKEAH